jgi:ABC-type transport system involved in Fe-S cluster assembly fused permease/ATPase subunit
MPGEQLLSLVNPAALKKGKSTVIGLLEHWYDVKAGSASLDSLDVREWNLSNLRSHVALVGQVPVLFNVSIRENIDYGAIGLYCSSPVNDPECGLYSCRVRRISY